MKPKTKKFEHQYNSNGDIFSIECWYQSVTEMTSMLVGEKLAKLKTKPKDVQSIDFILSGDHGKEVFPALHSGRHHAR